MAEHSMVPDSEDPRRNSRTVFANPLEKLLFAPLNVNYHSEHHLAMSVPSYHLPALRKKMTEKGRLDYGLTTIGYWSIIRQAASKK
jgi:fatty acid desaturase